MRDAWVNSWKRRVFPIPGSPMTATTWPCPAPACSRASCRVVSSPCRPTKGVSPRAANACRRVRAGPAPTSSHTSTGAGSPLTGTGPKGVTCTQPSASRRVSAVSRMLPGGRAVPCGLPGASSDR